MGLERERYIDIGGYYFKQIERDIGCQGFIYINRQRERVRGLETRQERERDLGIGVQRERGERVIHVLGVKSVRNIKRLGVRGLQRERERERERDRLCIMNLQREREIGCCGFRERETRVYGFRETQRDKGEKLMVIILERDILVVRGLDIEFRG